MGATKTIFSILCLSIHAAVAHSAKLLDAGAILRFKPQSDNDGKDKEIDDLMPSGGGDENNDEQKRAKLLDAIHHFMLQSDNDGPDEEIDDLRPFGSGNETNEEQKVETRADYGRALEELISPWPWDERYAPSDESFEHFEKMKPGDFTLRDVKEFERRNAIGADKRWPFNTVPYEFDDEITDNSEEKGQIYTAMREWMEKTCVKFEPYSSRLARRLGHNQRIRLQGNLTGCNSKVGMQGGKWGAPQIVSLERPGCMHARVVMHELGHALGFHHEQTRQDRDKFLNVYEEHVEASHLHNYKKVGDEYLAVSTPYDYLSIMQYGKDAFGKTVNGHKEITEEPKRKCYEDLIGKARHLSYYDHKLMNSIYGCTKECDSTLCDKNCYSTKSGENGKCHCVCLDNSNNPCMGGSCFEGDIWNNCAELIAKSPSATCFKHGVGGRDGEECCESCKGVKIDTECPLGDYYNNCAKLVKKNPTGRCSQRRRDKCCESCKGISVDPRCPEGNTISNCDELIAKYGKERTCKGKNGPKCCSSCL